MVPIGLDGVLTDEEKKLYDILDSPRPGAGLNDLEGGVSPLPDAIASSNETDASSQSVEPSSQEFYTDLERFMPPRQIVILTFSCIAALLAMGCIGIGLYAWHHFTKSTKFEAAWEMIPRVEARDAVEIVVDDDFATRFKDKKATRQSQDIPEQPSNPALALSGPTPEETLFHPHPEQMVISLDSEDESDNEGFEEKFHDAEEVPFYTGNATNVQKTEVPVILIEEHGDPDYLPLPQTPAFRSSTPYSTPPPTPPRSPYRRIVEMREAAISRPSSPVSKPAWSLRASDAPALGFSGADARTAPVPLPLPLPPRAPTPAQTPVPLSIPGSLPAVAAVTMAVSETEKQMVERPRARRAYRTPVPELDIAFALQLRPGLGLGSDPAWIVRFLMAMFGWMTVLFGSSGTVMMRRDRRAIA